MAGKRKLFAKVIGGKLLITAHAAVAGGKSTMGTSRLTVDEFPSSNASVCYSVSQSINNAQVIPDSLTVAILPQTSAVKMVFTVGDVIDNGLSQVLFLVYSSTQTSQAEFTSTVSDYQLGLPLANIGVLGVYNLPAIQSQPQAPSAIGQADSTVKSKLVFNIDLDPAKIAALQASGGNQLFFQAGLISQADLNAGILSSMILSEVDAITFINGSCPVGNASISADGKGGKTTTASNNVSLSKSPTSTNVGGKISTSGKTSSGSGGDSSGKSSGGSGGSTNTGGK
jgi:hypothetical protein